MATGKIEEKGAERRGVGRGVVLPVAALTIALLTAFLGALLTGSPTEGVNARVELLSGTSSAFLGDLSTLVPLGFAFGAGMVSAVNPCGFSLLPAYLGIFLQDQSKGGDGAARGGLGRALVVGATVTGGFTVLFAAVGLLIGGGSQFVVGAFPWIGFSIGLILVLAGAYLLRGGHVYTAFGERLAGRIGGGAETNLRGYFLFGVSYGTASLSCTLPIFLTVVGSSIAVSNLASSLGQFLLYGLGMGVVILALTISIALFRSALVGQMRRLLPYVERVGTALLLVAGTYIVYYWLTIGGLLDQIG